MNNIELKPCPFCGSKNLRIPKEFKITKAEDLKVIETIVQCIDCGASGSPIGYIDNVRVAWNKRSILMSPEDECVLQKLQDVFMRLMEIKNYVMEQKELMVEKYPKETHGYQVLNYLHKSLLSFVKDEGF